MLSNLFRTLAFSFNQINASLEGSFDWEALISKTECQNVLERLHDCIFNIKAHSDELFYSENDTSFNVCFTLRDYLIRNALRLVKSLIKSTFLYHDPRVSQVALDLFLLKKFNGSLLVTYGEYSNIKAGMSNFNQNRSRFEGHMLVQSLILEDIFFILKANSQFLNSFLIHGRSKRPSRHALSFVPICVAFENLSLDLFNFLSDILESSPEPICAFAIDIMATFFPIFKSWVLKNDRSVRFLLGAVCSCNDFCKDLARYRLLHHLLFILQDLPVEKKKESYTILLEFFIIDNAYFPAKHEKPYADVLLNLFSLFDSIFHTLTEAEIRSLFQKLESFGKKLVDAISSNCQPEDVSTMLTILPKILKSQTFISFIQSSQMESVVDFMSAMYFLFMNGWNANDNIILLESMGMLKSFFDLTLQINLITKLGENSAASRLLRSLKFNLLTVFDNGLLLRHSPEISARYFELLSLLLKYGPFLDDWHFNMEFIRIFEGQLGHFHPSSSLVKFGVKALELFTSSISNLVTSTTFERFSNDQIEFYFQIIFKTLSLFPSARSHSIRAIGLLFSILDQSYTDQSVKVNVFHGLKILSESISTGEHKTRWNAAHAVEVFFLNENLVKFLIKGNFQEFFYSGNILNDFYVGIIANILHCKNFKVQSSSCKALNTILRTYILPYTEMKILLGKFDISNILIELRFTLSQQTLSEDLTEARDKLLDYLSEAINLYTSTSSSSP